MTTPILKNQNSSIQESTPTIECGRSVCSNSCPLHCLVFPTTGYSYAINVNLS